jgi:hypothetical protein
MIPKTSTPPLHLSGDAIQLPAKKVKPIYHRGTEAQRKARKMKAISGFLAVDFLCVSVSLWLMVFRLLRLQRMIPKTSTHPLHLSGDAIRLPAKKVKPIYHRGTEAQRKAREMKAVSGFLAVDFLCVSVSCMFCF